METIDEFIEFFENTPDDKWTLGTLGDFYGCKCALGHLGLKSYEKNDQEFKFDNVEKLAELINPNLNELKELEPECYLDAIFSEIYTLNDTCDSCESKNIKEHFIDKLKEIRQKRN